MRRGGNGGYVCYMESVRRHAIGRELPLRAVPAGRGGRGSGPRRAALLLAMLVAAGALGFVLSRVVEQALPAFSAKSLAQAEVAAGQQPAAPDAPTGAEEPLAGPSVPQATGAGPALPPADGGPVLLEVAPLLQNPELMNGCEATVLAMGLNHYGFEVDKLTAAYEILPREDFRLEEGVRYGPHPDTAYAGDPATRQGFYCFAPAVCRGANTYLQQQGSRLQCRDISGSGGEVLEEWLWQGSPVMLWVTLDYSAEVQYLDYSWTLPDGSRYTPYKNLHCVLLCGFDETSYTLNDPLAGRAEVDKETLLASYWALGSHAAVITP